MKLSGLVCLLLSLCCLPCLGNEKWKPADRHVKLESQSNFRDLGGYKTTDGRTVKRGQIYRSGELLNLTISDKSVLNQLEIKKIVGFLTDKEIEKHGRDPHRYGQENYQRKQKIHRLPILGTVGDQARKAHEAIRSADFSELPPDLNPGIHRILIQDKDACGRYSELLKLATISENRPLVFHCSHGIHRTGTAAAILLWTLGVPWETVREDYLLSNTYRQQEVEKKLAQLRQLAARNQGIAPDKVNMTNINAFYKLDGSYIDAARDEILKSYGSLEKYLTAGLGLTQSETHKLRNELLE